MSLMLEAVEHGDKVARLWGTNVALGALPIQELVHPHASITVDADGPALQVLPLQTWVANVDALTHIFLDTMRRLAVQDRVNGVSVRPVQRVSLSLQVWRCGHEVPMYSTSGSYLGWLFLHGTESHHSDSGTVSILDPRAGSSMSAVPGLPWGRSLTVRPTPGSLAVVPGWLTTSVLPLERHQTSVVVVATEATDAVGNEPKEEA